MLVSKIGFNSSGLHSFLLILLENNVYREVSSHQELRDQIIETVVKVFPQIMSENIYLRQVDRA